VLDLGCGFGDTTQQLAALVGPGGEAVGVDVSEPFIAAAREEAQSAGIDNVRFRSGDVQIMDLGEGFDYAFSRWESCSSPTPCRHCATCDQHWRPAGGSAPSSGGASSTTHG